MRIALFAVLVACGPSEAPTESASELPGSAAAGSAAAGSAAAGSAAAGSAAAGSEEDSRSVVAGTTDSGSARSDAKKKRDELVDEIMRDDLSDEPTMLRPRAIELAPTKGSGHQRGHQLGKDEINRVMQRAASKFKACFVAHLSSHPGARGKIVASFTIEAAGTVTAVTARGLDSSVEACVAGAVAQLVFPASESVSKVSFPLIFSGQ